MGRTLSHLISSALSCFRLFIPMSASQALCVLWLEEVSWTQAHLCLRSGMAATYLVPTCACSDDPNSISTLDSWPENLVRLGRYWMIISRFLSIAFSEGKNHNIRRVGLCHWFVD